MSENGKLLKTLKKTSLIKKEPLGAEANVPQAPKTSKQTSDQYNQFDNLKRSYDEVLGLNDDLNHRLRQLKLKCINILKERDSAFDESEKEKSILLRKLEIVDLELSKFRGIAMQIFNQEEIDNIVSQSKFNQRQGVWEIVKFWGKAKGETLPSLDKKKSQGFQSSIEIKKKIEDRHQKSGSLHRKNEYQTNQILKEVRRNSNLAHQEGRYLRTKTNSLCFKHENPRQKVDKRVSLAPMRDREKKIVEDLRRNKHLKLKEETKQKSETYMIPIVLKKDEQLNA